MSDVNDILNKLKAKKGNAANQGIDADSEASTRLSSRTSAPRHENITWIFMYGDLMSLLLIFFILLYSMSSINKERFEEAIDSVKEAIGGQKSEAGTKSEATPISKVLSDIKLMVEKEKLTDAVKIDSNYKGILISVGDKILFSEASAILKRPAKLILNRLAKVIKGIPYKVEVSGHTDNIPMKSKRYPTNWELSTARACSVVRYLVKYGEVLPERLVAKGYAEFSPKVQNVSTENRAENRRIEILILQHSE